MQIISRLEKKKYLKELREQMESWFAFGERRFTGVVIGSFLYITHHAGYEWNRRITNEKSRAIGFVTRRGDGCAVNVICLRGYFEPVSLYLLYLFSQSAFSHRGIPDPDSHILAAVAAVVFCAITAVQCWFTERGQASMEELHSLLHDPVLPWEDSEI